MATATRPKIIDLIPELYDRVGDSNTYFQIFEEGGSGMMEARNFAEGLREQVGEFARVEQRNNKVYITIN